MPDYKLSKIYKIESYQTREVYYGSTTQTLLLRFSGHKADYKRWKDGKSAYVTSFKILAYDDSTITLIENFPCDKVEELVAREAYYIRNDENSINKIIPQRTRIEWLAVNNNKDLVKISQKAYQDLHKDEIYEKKKINKISFNCECGGKYNNFHKASHHKSLKHINFINSQKNDEII